MKLTNAYLAKRTLIDALQAVAIPSGALDGVLVEYRDPAQDQEREQVYGGRVRWVHEPDSDPGLTREVAVVEIIIRVVAPGDSPEETDSRAEQIGDAVATIVFGLRDRPIGANSWQWVQAGTSEATPNVSEGITTIIMSVQVTSYL